jgi:thymidylate synthase (FAD)
MRTDELHPEAKKIQWLIEQGCNQAFTMYRSLLLGGCPRELARAVLPVATYSHMFTTLNLHNLMRFLKLRLHPHAQYEIRVYAEAMLELIRSVTPVTIKYFEKELSTV